MRLAGTCSMYSKRAMPQLTKMASSMGADLNRRCPYQATVMKMLERNSSPAAVSRSCMSAPDSIVQRRMAWSRGAGAEREDPIVAIERGELDPIYCLHGAERYLVDRCVNAVRKAILGTTATAPSFNADVFDLKDSNL